MQSLPRRSFLGGAVALVACARGARSPTGVEMNPTFACSIPLTFNHGLPEAEVAFGDVRLSLMIDVGAFAELSLSAPALARVPGVAFTGQTSRFSDALGARHVARNVVVADLAIGLLQLRNASGQELVFSERFAPPNRDGYVGRALLARHRLLFDYDARLLTLLSGPEQPIEADLRGGEAPLEVDREGLFVRARLDADDVRLVVDTGSTCSVLRTQDGAGTRGVRRRLQLGSLTLEDFELALAPAGPPSADGMLGRNFFEGRRVLLDLPGRRIRIGGG